MEASEIVGCKTSAELLFHIALIPQIRKSKDYVYGIWVYKAFGIWKGYYRVKKITGFVRETVYIW